MTLDRLSELAEAAATRYDFLTDALQGVFGRFSNSIDFGKADQFQRLENDAADMVRVYLEAEERYIADALKEVAGVAHQTISSRVAHEVAQFSETAALELLSETESYLQSELIAQATRDVALTRSTLQRVTMQVKIAARSRRIPLRRAWVEHKIANQETPLAFVFLDRLSRQWKSRNFIRTAWRQTLVSARNEVALSLLAESGHDKAVVASVIDGSEIHIASISFTGAPGLPSYDDVRAEHFHPYSQAYLIPEVANV